MVDLEGNFDMECDVVCGVGGESGSDGQRMLGQSARSCSQRVVTKHPTPCQLSFQKRSILD